MRSSVVAARLPEHVSAVCLKELDRLERTDPSIAEYSIGVNYIDYLLSLLGIVDLNEYLIQERIDSLVEDHLTNLLAERFRMCCVYCRGLGYHAFNVDWYLGNSVLCH